jgi:transaldolase
MALFLDSADLDEAREAASYGFVVGCTTNPTLLARAGHKDAYPVLGTLCGLFEGTVFYQLMGHGLEEMRAEARRFMALGSNLGLKIPCTLTGLRFAAEIAPEATVAITAVFSPSQAYLCAQAGAHYAIPYVNRVTRATGDGPDVVAAMAELLVTEECEILAAGIKSPAEAVQTLLAGADHVSLPLDVIRGMAENALTEKAIADFEASWLEIK